MKRGRVLIVGAGPAGSAAALWARSRGLEVRVLEREPISGGQLNAIHFHPAQLPGIENGDGRALAESAARQLTAAGVVVETSVGAVSLEPGASEPAMRASDGSRYGADAVLIACGLERRRLGIPGERELEGRGVSLSATRDLAALKGGDVMVVGGGDAAFENALLLAAAGSRVTLVVRGEPHARRSFRERVAAESRVTLLTGTRVTALLGEERLRAARLETPDGEREMEWTAAVIKIGRTPSTAWCAPPLATDDAGFIRVDTHGRTSAAGVWAAGDVTRPPLFAISVAHGSAAVAISDIARALLDT